MSENIDNNKLDRKQQIEFLEENIRDLQEDYEEYVKRYRITVNSLLEKLKEIDPLNWYFKNEY